MKTISSINEMRQIVHEIQMSRLHNMLHNGTVSSELYRGQGRNEWSLLPNLARKISVPIEAKRIEKLIINDFNDELIRKGLPQRIQGAFFDKPYHGDWLLLQQAQHYRIPTRFMDWTARPEVALFFAVSEPLDDDYDGQFWFYNVPPFALSTDDLNLYYLNQDPYEFDGIMLLNPSTLMSADSIYKIAQNRQLRQHGRFCIQPYDVMTTPLELQPMHKELISKFIVPASSKAKIRSELESLGYTSQRLFVEEDPKIAAIVTNLRKKYHV